MLFSGATFLYAFLPIVLLCYALAPGVKAKNYVLLIASLVFYFFGEPVYVLLLIFSSISRAKLSTFSKSSTPDLPVSPSEPRTGVFLITSKLSP